MPNIGGSEKTGVTHACIQEKLYGMYTSSPADHHSLQKYTSQHERITEEKEEATVTEFDLINVTSIS